MNSHSVIGDCGTSKEPTSGGWSGGKLEILCGDGGQLVGGLVADGANSFGEFSPVVASAWNEGILLQ